MFHHESMLREAVRLALDNRGNGGRPFGAVLTMDDEVVAVGVNDIVHSHDPTAHAEMAALRTASQRLQRPDLSGAIMYASGHPCPMCLAAMVIAGIKAVYYAFDNNEAAPHGYSSDATYRKLGINLERPSLPLTRLELGVAASELYGPPNKGKQA
jgi:guanine deaminase